MGYSCASKWGQPWWSASLFPLHRLHQVPTREWSTHSESLPGYSGDQPVDKNSTTTVISPWHRFTGCSLPAVTDRKWHRTDLTAIRLPVVFIWVPVATLHWERGHLEVDWLRLTLSVRHRGGGRCWWLVGCCRTNTCETAAIGQIVI